MAFERTLMESADYAIQNKLTPFISMQNHYNLVYREHEREIIPTLKVSSSYLLPNFAYFRVSISISVSVRCLGHLWLEVCLPAL